MDRLTKTRSQAKKSLKITIQKMAPAVLTALIATTLGFIALYTSPVPMIQDFGKMLSLGMIISFIVGVFILIPLLYIRDGFFRESEVKIEQKSISISTFDRFLNWWTNKVMMFRWVILIVAIGLAALGIVLDLEAPAETDVETFMPQESEALADINYVREVLGSTSQVSLIYEGEDILSDSTLTWVERISEDIVAEFPNEVVKIQSLPELLDTIEQEQRSLEISSNSTYGFEDSATVNKVDLIELLPEDQRNRFINTTNTKGVIHINIEKMSTEELESFVEELKSFIEGNRIGSLETTLTGQSILDLEMVTALTTGRYQMTLLGMALVFLGLLAIYRRPEKAIIPLLPILLIVGWSGLVVYGLGIEYTPLTATLGALIIGIGTEFTILLMERYYEERQAGASNRTAILIANQKIGKAIFASALTTIGGFSALLFSDFAILSDFGMMTLINIGLALISTILVLPALLMIVGPWIYREKLRQSI
ncbi:efflux RND transporter permease subunit [Aquisalibacillus elongatus]|nr:MMPL family transporter [Aquisalibacillus elongatus]